MRVIAQLQPADKRHPGQDQRQLECVLWQASAAVQARHQVSYGHKDKAGGGQGHHVGQRPMQIRQEKLRHQSPAGHGGAREAVEHESALGRVAVVQEDGEISQFLRHFV